MTQRSQEIVLVLSLDLKLQLDHGQVDHLSTWALLPSLPIMQTLNYY